MLPDYWSSPETTAINRLPMLNIEHYEKLSLDGIWRFQLLRKPTDSVRKRWSKIPVPGLWTMQPKSNVFFDKPIEAKEQLPFDHTPPYVPAENPTGIYERDFEIPGSWENKRVVLQLGGYESVALIWINGDAVGLTKDSRLAAEFDITKFLKGGKNTIRIHVTKWSDATYIEGPDQWWHGGITRSVKLYATNDVFIERLYTTTGLKADNTTGTLKVEAFIGSVDGKNASGYTLRARIEEFSKLKSATIAGSISAADSNRILLETTIPKVKPWSAENPVLYTLAIELFDPAGNIVQISSQRIGFRSVVIKGREFLVNGQAVIFYGVDRHDFNEQTGRVVTRDDMRQDLLELKRWNFNAVRTSHYPNDPAFLDLCDELGFYVVEEANLEPRAFSDSICNDPRYLGAFVERVGRMVERDIHHPSVVMWSLGNESQKGRNLEAAAAYARAADPSRPLHYEFAIRNDWNSGLQGGFISEFWGHGLVLPDRTAKPVMYEFKAIAAPAKIARVKASSGQFTIFNKQFFAGLEDFELLWVISRDGINVDGGRVKLPTVAPRKTGRFTVKTPHLLKADGKGKRFITFTLLRKSSTAWAPSAAEISWNQFALPSKAK